MPQYLLSIYQPDDGVPPAAELERIMDDVRGVNRAMDEAGIWTFRAGLHPAEISTVVRVEHGETLVTDGPFAEGKEHLGGFSVIDVPDLDVALHWARRLATALTPLSIEVRPVVGEDERGCA